MRDGLKPGLIKEIDALRVSGEGNSPISEKVITDEELTIKIDGRVAARLTYLPSEPELLGWGFLVSGGWISSAEEVKTFRLGRNILNVELMEPKEGELASILSSCGKEVTLKAKKQPEEKDHDGPGKIPVVPGSFLAGDVFSAMAEFQKIDVLHGETGGTHSAGIARGGVLLFNFPDVGRHNAVQKVLGRMLVDKVPASDKVLFTTGRISSEMVTACAELSIPVIVSKSAPMSSALDRARERGVTVIGFARGRRMTCYTFPERLKIESLSG